MAEQPPPDHDLQSVARPYLQMPPATPPTLQCLRRRRMPAARPSSCTAVWPRPSPRHQCRSPSPLHYLHSLCRPLHPPPPSPIHRIKDQFNFFYVHPANAPLTASSPSSLYAHQNIPPRPSPTTKMERPDFIADQSDGRDPKASTPPHAPRTPNPKPHPRPPPPPFVPPSPEKKKTPPPPHLAPRRRPAFISSTGTSAERRRRARLLTCRPAPSMHPT